MSRPSNGTAPDAIRDIVPPCRLSTDLAAAPGPTMHPGLAPKREGQRTRPRTSRQIHRPGHPREPVPTKAGGNARMTTAG
jgi:hypothetical protein